jgi:hypothetical protein
MKEEEHQLEIFSLASSCLAYETRDLNVKENPSQLFSFLFFLFFFLLFYALYGRE